MAIIPVYPMALIQQDHFYAIIGPIGHVQHSDQRMNAITQAPIIAELRARNGAQRVRWWVSGLQIGLTFPLT